MDEFVTKEVHAEFARRIEAEETRQNRRLENVENDIRDLQRMTTAVEKLAVNMEALAKEQAKMSTRLEAIEDEPADNWRKAVWIVVSALIGAGVAMLLQGVI